MNYLNKGLKNKLLKELEEAITRENVDDRWIKHLIKVNEVDGVGTVGCCQGHRRAMLTSSSRGYISLIFTEETQKLFDESVEWLLDKYPVMCVKKSYGNLVGDNLRYFDHEYYCFNEVYFELWAFTDFVDDCLYPLLEKLNG